MLGLMLYLFSEHHWSTKQLVQLYTAPTGQHDLILALASYEAHAKNPEARPRGKVIKTTKRRRR